MLTGSVSLSKATLIPKLSSLARTIILSLRISSGGKASSSLLSTRSRLLSLPSMLSLRLRRYLLPSAILSDLTLPWTCPFPSILILTEVLSAM